MNINNPFGDNYPFIGPPGSLKDPKYVYDIYVTYYDPELQYKLPLRLVSLSRESITLVDADGNIIYDGSLRKSLWGNDYIILQNNYYPLNLSISVIASKDLPSEYRPANGDICLRCVHTQPKHVTSFEVNGSKLKGDVVFNYGKNIEYTTEYTDDFRPKTSIILEANPGAGLGQWPATCTQSSNPITSIDGREPNEYGDIYIGADECISISMRGNSIIARDDCIPCCGCKDFSKEGKRLDKTIDKYYKIGGTVELARDCLLDLTELLNCGNKVILQTDTFCPVRSYLDTTWPRHPGFTAEFRNVFPAIVTNLTVKVTAICSPLIKHQALRTMQMQTVACDDVQKDTQDGDNYTRVSVPEDTWEPCNSWTIDWTDRRLGPGATVWCTIAARNCGVDAETGGFRTASDSWMETPNEQVTLIVEASYTLEPNDCVSNKEENIDILECFDGFTIHNTHTSYGIIKGGYSYDDYTTDDGDIGVKDRIKELCTNRFGGEWHA